MPGAFRFAGTGGEFTDHYQDIPAAVKFKFVYTVHDWFIPSAESDPAEKKA
ncbi:hypothetical protein [Morganella morganii]|uniref:hypothetical protein n=1 Tax=Morganella morganii TaxID=582 RepID=UPI001D159265|nr:hypothetical protein [Morganella morganii]